MSLSATQTNLWHLGYSSHQAGIPADHCPILLDSNRAGRPDRHERLSCSWCKGWDSSHLKVLGKRLSAKADEHHPAGARRPAR